MTPERIDEYVAPLLRPGSGGRCQATAAARPAPSLGLPGLMARVRAPTLVVWGAQDAWVPVTDADRFLAAIPGSRKAVLDACGHIPQEERPAEDDALLTDFLARVTSRAPAYRVRRGGRGERGRGREQLTRAATRAARRRDREGLGC